MRFELESAHKLRIGRVDHECIKQIDVIADEEAGPSAIEAGRIMRFEANSGKPERILRKN